LFGDELAKEGRRGSDGGGAEVEEEGDHDGRDGLLEGVVGGAESNSEIDLSEGVSDVEETRDVVGDFDDVATLDEEIQPRKLSQRWIDVRDATKKKLTSV